MRNHILAVVLGLAVSVLSSCRSMAPAPAPLSDPSEVVSTLIHAFNNLDADELGSLFAEDATAFLPFPTSGMRLNGREAIMRAIQPMFTAERMRSSHGAPYLALTAKDLKVQRIGQDVAIASFDVGNQHVFSRRTVVLHLIARRWRVVHMHASNIRTETSAG